MTNKTVVLVGASGRLGSHIAAALLDRPDVSVRVLSRSETTEGRQALERRGATCFVGDLASASGLDAAVEGAFAVISAVNGGPEVVIEGQSRLLDVAERHGVTRFIPSDYSLDFFALDDGDNVFLDLRRAFAKRIERSKLQYSHVMIGALTEVHLSKPYGIFDLEAGTATPWGTGAELVDVTTLADAGRFIAEVALDEGAPKRVSFAGDAVSVMDVATSYARITGRALDVRSRGSIAELEDWIRGRKATARSPLEYVFAQYQLAQINGKGKLHELDNARYPQIVPTKTPAVLDLWLSR
jgi:nucleoside-diphosphate-sugar epimerase